MLLLLQFRISFKSQFIRLKILFNSLSLKLSFNAAPKYLVDCYVLLIWFTWIYCLYIIIEFLIHLIMFLHLHANRTENIMLFRLLVDFFGSVSTMDTVQKGAFSLDDNDVFCPMSSATQNEMRSFNGTAHNSRRIQSGFTEERCFVHKHNKFSCCSIFFFHF